MVWKPGQSGNPGGRPRIYPVPPNGSNNWRDYGLAKLREELKFTSQELGLEDPLEFQHKRMADESLPLPLRCAIAANITPYYHPRLGQTVPPRYIETPIEVPDFKSTEEAETFLASLATRFAKSELGAQSSLDLSTLVRNWISAKHDDLSFDLPRSLRLAASAERDRHRRASNSSDSTSSAGYRGAAHSPAGHYVDPAPPLTASRAASVRWQTGTRLA